MSQPYRQLVLDERRTIFRLLNAKLPIDAIAKEIGRHRSTLYREIRRNRFNDVKEYQGYYPVTADDSARARRQRQRKLVRDASLRAYVLEKLALWWSPEQIAGRLRRGGMSGRVCHETIYQFIYGPEGRALGLHRHLLRARRLRRRRFGRRPHSPKIPLERTITQRPAAVGRRDELGHWEADLLIFRRAHGKANVTSLVERKSRLIRLLQNTDRRSPGVVGAIGDALATLPPPARQTITFDRGSEFLGYDHLTRVLGIDAYFCDPHAPWQKGSIENTNGRLRRFLPSETDGFALRPSRDREPDEHLAPQVPRLHDAQQSLRRGCRLAGSRPTVALHLETAAQS